MAVCWRGAQRRLIANESAGRDWGRGCFGARAVVGQKYLTCLRENYRFVIYRSGQSTALIIQL